MLKNTEHDAQVQDQLRQLALVDKIIGLEAELARLEIIEEQRSLEVMRYSREWRIGSAVLAPVRFVKTIFVK